MCGVFFFKQKTADELRISDWSSDVCSSDLNVDLATGAVIPAPRVVRHDGDDTYLVVAADKGTATFSDIANDVAAQYGFWLGDAFASGGSVGYDHKALGITRSEEPRVGKECGSPGRSRLTPYL